MKYAAVADTNLLVRYIMRDEPPEQTQDTVALIDSSPPRSLYVPAVVVTELTWALKAHYQATRLDISSALLQLLLTPSLGIDITTHEAILLYAASTNAKLDFADCYLAATGKQGDFPVVTYDKDMRRAFPDVRMITSGELLAWSAEA